MELHICMYVLYMLCAPRARLSRTHVALNLSVAGQTAQTAHSSSC